MEDLRDGVDSDVFELLPEVLFDVTSSVESESIDVELLDEPLDVVVQQSSHGRVGRLDVRKLDSAGVREPAWQ